MMSGSGGGLEVPSSGSGFGRLSSTGLIRRAECQHFRDLNVSEPRLGG